MKCPKCGSTDVEVNGLYYKCNSCGYLDDSTLEMIMEGSYCNIAYKNIYWNWSDKA